MNLSNELISQFVKITNDKPETKKETTVYGTTVIHEGVTYVRLDGSELLTPVTSTASTKDGERVTVMIKNHTATITGNISSPSASSKELSSVASDTSDNARKITEFEIALGAKAEVEDLQAETARIDLLTADNVIIKQNLATANAEIETLQANEVTVTQQLNANKANIENLQTTKLDASIATATYATIDNLEATNADINNLEATYAAFEQTTTNRLEAQDAAIAKLEAGDISTDVLDARYAQITSLDASNARITDLEADVADIDTLIFGSATGSTIQTSFANAVIAQLGAAQIKSAMIESIAASKITSGDIITNNVRVKSQNGLLLISDETLQISDGTRARVQIGKDASNDYSINIWDASGNLMFSKGGITDSAIKSAIIRNDMVSDTANIAAHKLDIDSLFEEINDDTSNTIKATKVYLDEEGQTLDVAFQELTTAVTEQGETVSSQGTQITAIQGQISSKIWQQDITSATNEIGEVTDNLSTQYNTLKQTVDSNSSTIASHTAQIAKKADSSTVTTVSDRVATVETNLTGFQSTVSTTYATKTQLNDLTIGGRNLLLNTGGDSLPVMSNGGEYTWSGISNPSSADGVVTLPCNASTSEIYYRFMQPTGGVNKLYGMVPGEIYILSGKVKAATTSGSLNYVSIRTQESINGGGWSGGINTTILSADTDEWIYFACPFKISANATGYYASIQGYYDGSWTGTLTFTDLKLEKGTKATDWTPAPEDMSTNETVGKIESSISQLSDRISSNVAETDNLGTRMTTVEQTSTGLTTRLNEMVVGGTNMLKYSNDDPRGSASGPTLVTNAYLGFNAAYYNNSSGTGTPDVSSFASCVTPEPNTEYTLSFYAKGSGRIYSYFYPDAVASGKSNIGQSTGSADGNIQHVLTSDWKKYVITWKTQSGISGTKSVLPMRAAAGATCYICGIKFEKGNVATDWSPSPVEIDNAAKTATDYLNFSSSGLVVGDHTADTLKKNVLIDSDSVDIRDGSKVLASFGADKIELGKHSKSSVIDLCNGTGSVRADVYDPVTNSSYSAEGLFLESDERVVVDSKIVRLNSDNKGESTTGSSQAHLSNWVTSSAAYVDLEAASYDTTANKKYYGSFESRSHDLINDLSMDAAENQPYAKMEAHNGTYLNRIMVYPTFSRATQKLLTTGGIVSKGDILIGSDAYGNGGRALGVNKVLWSGSWYMNEDHTATLSEAVSKQPNGIVLVFSEYYDGAVSNTAFHTFFIPKQAVASHGGSGHCLQMTTSNLAYFATKYLYISDTKIAGHANNILTGASASGITRSCNRFIMRYVIGV